MMICGSGRQSNGSDAKSKQGVMSGEHMGRVSRYKEGPRIGRPPGSDICVMGFKARVPIRSSKKGLCF